MSMFICLCKKHLLPLHQGLGAGSKLGALCHVVNYFEIDNGLATRWWRPPKHVLFENAIINCATSILETQALERVGINVGFPLLTAKLVRVFKGFPSFIILYILL